MALRGIQTADWHFGGMSKVFPNGGATTRQMVEVDKIYGYAGVNGIKNIFIPGDISEKPILDQSDIIQLISMASRYDDDFITHYVVGNHDFHSVENIGKEGVISKTSMDVLKLIEDKGYLKNFHIHYKPKLVKIDGVYVCMMPFPHNEVLAAPRPPLVMAHIEMAGAIGDNGRILKHGNDDMFKRQPGDFIMSGHIHQYQHIKKKRFIYCGSPYQKNFGEALPKGFVDFTAKYVNGKLVVEHEFINNKPHFTLQQLLIQESADWDRLESDPNIRYKVLIGEGVIVPKNIMKDFPNIVYINGAAGTIKVNLDGSPDTTGSLTIQDLPKFNVKTGLKKYLKSAELTTAQSKRATELVRDAMNSLGLG